LLVVYVLRLLNNDEARSVVAVLLGILVTELSILVHSIDLLLSPLGTKLIHGAVLVLSQDGVVVVFHIGLHLHGPTFTQVLLAVKLTLWQEVVHLEAVSIVECV
jgi:hypothetical protein